MRRQRRGRELHEHDGYDHDEAEQHRPDRVLRQADRQADQQQIIRFSDGLVRGFSNANPLLQLARNIGLLGFDLLPGAKPLVARYAMGLSHV